MQFDFNLFSALTTKAYKNVGGSSYSLEDTLSVFKYYFQSYEDAFTHTKKVHPPIRMEQIERIILKMPYIGPGEADIAPELYEVLIDKHFQTVYRNCDYNINHFFAGNIRFMRYREEIN